MIHQGEFAGFTDKQVEELGDDGAVEEGTLGVFGGLGGVAHWAVGVWGDLVDLAGGVVHTGAVDGDVVSDLAFEGGHSEVEVGVHRVQPVDLFGGVTFFRVFAEVGVPEVGV